MIPISSSHEITKLRKALLVCITIMDWSDHDFYGVEEDVSYWSPAQQLLHTALTTSGSINQVNDIFTGESEQILPKGRPNKDGLLVMTFGHIPRGKVKAPPSVDAPPEVTREEVQIAIRVMAHRIEVAAERGPFLHQLTGKITHPALGALSALQWLKFARVHCWHHLSIVEDIRKSREKRLGGAKK